MIIKSHRQHMLGAATALLFPALLVPTLLSPAGTSAATLCVHPSKSGCYTRINDAISAAAPADTIQVSPGTYKEAVLIRKPLALVGDKATIDASGLSVGIFVNGMGILNLKNITVSGFTVKNANFEGILLANVAAVTIAFNKVLDNNKALTPSGCPGLPDFETLEQSDCGEGIHLLAANHSIISNNVSEGNSGGILLADDTGGTYANLISNNIVQNNPYACGITMASHPPAALTHSRVSLGVYHNTVYGNRSSRNGLSNGGGAGVGIFASVPGANTYGNVVANNYVNENGLPGIAMHAHVPGQNLSDNVLVGNIVVDNGPDDADATTPGPTGINLYGAGAVTGTIISGNFIQHESVDIAVKTTASVQVGLNSLLGTEVGLLNKGIGTVNATANWWGCSAGPGASGCSSASGSAIDFQAWLNVPPPDPPLF